MGNRAISDFAVSRIVLVEAQCHLDRMVPIGKGRASMEYPVTVEVVTDEESGQFVNILIEGAVTGYPQEGDNEASVFKIAVSILGVFKPQVPIDKQPGEEVVNELIKVLSPLVFQYVREYTSDLARKMGISGLGIPMELPP